MLAKDVMTAPVITVAPFTSVHAVAALLLQQRISGVPVVDSGELVGMVSEFDLIRRHEIGTDGAVMPTPGWLRLFRADPLPRHYVKTHGGRARDIMSRRPICASEDTDLSEVATLFDSRHIGRVPVLRDRRLVGIVTRTDLVRAVAANSVRAEPAPRPTDDAIRRRLLEELERQPWWQSSWSNVYVTGGVVSYRGLVESEAARQAARVAAENVSGVRGVDDDRTVSADWQAMT